MSRRFSNFQYVTIVILSVTCVFLWAKKFNLTGASIERHSTIELSEQDVVNRENDDMENIRPERLNRDYTWNKNKKEVDEDPTLNTEENSNEVKSDLWMRRKFVAVSEAENTFPIVNSPQTIETTEIEEEAVSKAAEADLPIVSVSSNPGQVEVKSVNSVDLSTQNGITVELNEDVEITSPLKDEHSSLPPSSSIDPSENDLFIPKTDIIDPK